MPEPLTPPECDLRDFPFMPLYVTQLRRSKAWLQAKREPEIGFYMLNLWAASWHDLPAASLEDDDDVLADLAMCEPRRWSKVRDKVLRGWVKCDDGRLYHATVAEIVLSSWAAKQAQRHRTEAARAARAQKRVAVPSAPDGNATGSVTDSAAETVAVSVTDNVTASKGEGQGESKGKGKDSPPFGSPAHAEAASPKPAAKPTTANSQSKRLPADWNPGDRGFEFAFAHRLNPPEEFERFRDHYLAAPGDRGRRVDWDATWRTWCRIAVDRRQRVGTSSGTEPRMSPSDRAREETMREMGLLSDQPPFGSSPLDLDGTETIQ